MESLTSVTGLAFIAGQLLLQSPEEDAFWIFISLMDSHLRPYFSSNAVQLDIDATLFAKAMETVDPTIAKKLFVDMAIPPLRVCRRWSVFPGQELDARAHLIFVRLPGFYRSSWRPSLLTTFKECGTSF